MFYAPVAQLDRASASGAEGHRFNSCLAYHELPALIACCTLSKEVNINFQTRTIGLFEIVEPKLEQDEVFDSNLLKQTIDSMISEGKRNISVDLAALDYLYSDTINALIVMNKRMLDVFGRLSLLAPQPPVMDILKKSGVQNILKIFADEAEIIRLSEELASQVGGIPSAAAHKAPVSEFDDLRAEIGSAFGDGLTAPPAAGPAVSAQPPAGARHAPGPVAQPHFTPPHPQPGLPHAPRAPMAAPHETLAASKPPLSQKTPLQKPQQDLDDFEATLDGRSAAKALPADRITRPAPTVAKRSPAIPVVIAVVALIVLGVGGYFAYINYFSSRKEPTLSPIPTTPETPKAAVQPAAPQPPAENAPEQVATPAPAEKPAETVAVAPAAPVEEQPAKETVTKRAAHAKAKAKRHEAVARKKAEAAAVQEAEAPASAAPAPAAVERKPAALAGEGAATTTFIASQPPNADVYLDGKLIGKSYTELQVTPGAHTLRLVKDSKEVTQQITFHPGKNPTTFISIK